MTKTLGKKESEDHIAFKKIAIDLLQVRGFSSSEIQEEYGIEFRVDGQTRYVVDIVGVKGDYKVAVECGETPHYKLIDLRKLFNEVLIVDVSKVVEMYEYWRAKYHTTVGDLTSENKRLKEHADWVCNDADSRIEPLKEEINKLEHEVERLKVKLRGYQKVLSEAWQTVNQPS